MRVRDALVICAFFKWKFLLIVLFITLEQVPCDLPACNRWLIFFTLSKAVLAIDRGEVALVFSIHFDLLSDWRGMTCC